MPLAKKNTKVVMSVAIAAPTVETSVPKKLLLVALRLMIVFMSSMFDSIARAKFSVDDGNSQLVCLAVHFWTKPPIFS